MVLPRSDSADVAPPPVEKSQPASKAKVIAAVVVVLLALAVAAYLLGIGGL
jgi:hypothetical protein